MPGPRRSLDRSRWSRLSGLSGRRRDWLIVLCVVLAIGIYWTVWTQYTRTHTITRYVAAAPGAAATRDGQTLRVLSVVRTTTLVSKYPDSEPQVAPAGGEFVVAQLEITVDADTEYPSCDPTLLGPDGRTWERMTLSDVSRAKETLCSDAKAGVSVPVENIYEIPSVYADQIVGFAWDDPSSAAPVVVLTPPR